MLDTPAVQTGYLTKEEFVALYGRCSDVLHAENPFSRNEDDVVAFLFQEIPQPDPPASAWPCPTRARAASETPDRSRPTRVARCSAGRPSPPGS